MNNLLTVSAILLLGMAGGYLAHRTRVIPRITGYMAVGLLFGPSALNLLSAETMNQGQMMVDIALGLILFTIGTHLDPHRIRNLKPQIAVAAGESALAFVLMFFALKQFGVSPVMALTVAAVGMSSSPAVVLLVAKEFDAKGPVTESLLTITAVNNVLSFLAYSVALPFVHGEGGRGVFWMILHPAYLLAGSAALGAVLGYPLGFVHRRLTRPADMLLLTVGVILATIGLARAFHLSPLMAMIALGAVSESHGASERQVELEFGHAADVFYLSLFVVSGASLHLELIPKIGWVGVIFIAARMSGKLIGTICVGRLFGMGYRTSGLIGLGLVPMAAMAIGLARATAEFYPEFGADLSAIVLSAVVVFETLGPFFTEFALKRAGEIQGSVDH